MQGFAGAIDAIFANPVIAAAAVYRAGGEGPGVPVRIVRRRPDEISEFNGGRFVRDTVIVDVRVAEIPGLAPGDTFEVEGETIEVQGEPILDGERLFLRAEARPI